MYNFQHIRDIERDVTRPRSCSLRGDSAISIRTARKFSRSQWPLDLPRRRWAPFHPLSLCLHSLCLPPVPAVFPSSVSRCSYRAGDFSSIGQLPNDNHHTEEYCSCTRNACVCFVYWCKSTVSLISRACDTTRYSDGPVRLNSKSCHRLNKSR